MEDIYLIILAFVTAIVVIALTYFWTKRRFSSGEREQGLSEDSLQLEKQLELKNKKVEELNGEVANLNSLITNLQSELDGLKHLMTVESSGDENVIVSSEVSTSLEQCEVKLKKVREELKNAEDDLEIAEEEAADYKKKWNDQKQKLNEKSIALEQCEEKLHQVQRNLDDTVADLLEQKESLSKKVEVIKFINEILQAKDADTKDIREINAKIDNIQNFVEGNLCDVLKGVNVLTNEEAKEYKLKIWQWANLQRKTWLQRNKVIAFVGEFSAGKTTIVNRILSQDDDNAPKLPVSSKATTAIPTYISHAFDFNSQFTDSSGKLKTIKKSTFEMVSKDILAEANVSSLIQYFVMSYKNKNLENLSILDTPGFASNDKEDTLRTSEVIREADVLLWVLDANVGEINQTSLDVIRDNLQGLPLFIIINKADSKSPKELNELELHIKETIRKNKITVSGYIRFSKNESLTRLMDAIKSIPHNNSKNAFIFTLYKILEDKIAELNVACSSEEKKYRSLEKQNDKCIDALAECFEDIENCCEAIVKIPEYKSKWFTANRYEMTEESYPKFCEELGKINLAKDNIDSLCRDLKEIPRELQSKKANWDEVKENRRRLEDVKKRFDIILKKWNPEYNKMKY